MVNYIIIFFIFFSILFLNAISSKKLHNDFWLLFLGVVLIFFASFRDAGVDRDYSNYKEMFGYYKYLSPLITEPTFSFISGIVHDFCNNNIFFLFLIYAIIGVSLKLVAIRQLSKFWFLSLLIYLSNFFLLHEMTQIRAGIASAILLLSVKPMYERNFLVFFLYILLAALFHYSAVLIFPLYFLAHKKIPNSYSLGLIFFVYLIHFVGIQFTAILEKIPLDGIQVKVDTYNTIKEFEEQKINVFNVLQVLRLTIIGLFLWKKDLISPRNKYFNILFNIYVISVCSMVFFAEIPALAVRTSELAGIVEIILFPCLFYIIKPRSFAIFSVVFLGLLLLCTNLFYTKLLIFK